jgi:flagellar biosynthesis component FlhA
MLISLGDLTRVLRGLLAERVSVHDLRALLERLVQYGMVPADPTRYVVLDQRIPQVETTGLSAADRWRSLLAFARAGSGLRNYLSYRYADAQDRLRVMLLDSEFEGILVQTLGGPRVSHHRERRRHEQQFEAIRQEVWAALDRVGELADAPVVLVNTSMGRQLLREVVAHELPDLPIMARTEIRPEVRLEPLLTIHRPSAEVSTLQALSR